MRIDKTKFERSSFGIGEFNTRTMQALHKKYYRDYLPFFQELSKLYKQGKNKNEIVETINLVKKIQALLGDVIKEGSIKKDDADLLYSSVKKIEEKKLYFLEEVENVKALQEKIQKVEATTGISLEDLNVTKEVVEQGIRESRKKSESTGSFLKRTAPTMHGMAVGGTQAVAASLLGPFYGAAKGAYGLGKDVWSIGKGLREKRQADLGSSLRSDIRTSGSRVSSPEVTPESTQVARTKSPGIESFAGFSSKKPTLEEQSAPLQEFFDKGAYKAKWTKELLSSSKEKEKEGKKRFGFLGDFKAGILPFIGKAGLLAALAVGVGWSITKFNALAKEWSGLAKAKGGVKEAGEAAGSAAEMNLDVIQKMGIAEYAKAKGVTKRKAALDIANLEQRQALSKRTAQPWYKKSLDAMGITKRPELVNVTERTKEIEKLGRVSSTSKETPTSPEAISFMEDLNKTLKKLNEQMDKGLYQSVPNSKSSGNVFDAADSMVNDHASGRMTLGER